MLPSALLLSVALAAGPSSQPPDPWAGLRFLLGSWTTESGGGEPGQAVSGGFSFGLELDGRVAVRRGRSEYAPRAGATQGTRHEDLTVVFPDGQGLAASYWDSEGHQIRYAVRVEEGRVVFESAPGAPGPRFRLAYVRRGPDVVEVTFSIAPPGGEFRDHVSGLARRTGNPL